MLVLFFYYQIRRAVSVGKLPVDQFTTPRLISVAFVVTAVAQHATEARLGVVN